MEYTLERRIRMRKERLRKYVHLLTQRRVEMKLASLYFTTAYVEKLYYKKSSLCRRHLQPRAVSTMSFLNPTSNYTQINKEQDRNA